MNRWTIKSAYFYFWKLVKIDAICYIMNVLWSQARLESTFKRIIKRPKQGAYYFVRPNHGNVVSFIFTFLTFIKICEYEKTGLCACLFLLTCIIKNLC